MFVVVDPSAVDPESEFESDHVSGSGVFESDEVLFELTRAAYHRPVSDDTVGLPDGVDGWEPGPALAAVLAAVDVDRLAPADRVTYLKASERMVASQQAGSYRAMTAISDAYASLDPDPAVTEPAAALEIRAALRWTRRTAETELAFAHDLRHRLPRVHAALAAGRLNRRNAYVFIRHTEHLPIAQARTICDPLVDDAHRYTTGQLTARLRRARLAADPTDAARRHTTALAGRQVTSHPDPDGTLTLTGRRLDPVRAHHALDRINRLARRLKTAAEPRTMDQLRADIFLDLLCGTTDYPATGSVHLTIDLATLTHLTDHPGELAGYGPVIADIARHTTDHLHPATWNFTVTHPTTGQPLTDGTTRRRPTTTQTRQTRRRWPTCVAPGCRMPATGSDLDHTRPWAETHRTTTENLAPLCRHDHCIRHQTGWTYTPTPHGDITWTSPLGTKYTTSGQDP